MTEAVRREDQFCYFSLRSRTKKTGTNYVILHFCGTGHKPTSIEMIWLCECSDFRRVNRSSLTDEEDEGEKWTNRKTTRHLIRWRNVYVLHSRWQFAALRLNSVWRECSNILDLFPQSDPVFWQFNCSVSGGALWRQTNSSLELAHPFRMSSTIAESIWRIKCNF